MEQFKLDHEWTSISKLGVTSYAAALTLALFLAHRGDHWVYIVDDANLLFHEAGHPIFGMLSDRLVVYGGTLGQLTFPVVSVVSFYRQRASLSLAFAILWFGENLFNIARYMGDARAQLLPLIGNGEHDWTEIFSRWGVLAADHSIASLTRFFGWILVLGAGMWVLNQQSKNQFES
jgi:hypothetical protein